MAGDPSDRHVCFLLPYDNVHGRRWAAAMRDRFAKVTVVAPVPVGVVGTTEIVRPLYSAEGWFRRLRSRRNAREVVRTIEGTGADLLHVMSLFHLMHPALLPVLDVRLPMVASPWGSDVLHRREGIEPSAQVRLKRRLLARPEALTASSVYLARATAAYTDGREVTVVPYGVDTERFHPRDEPPPRGGPITIGYVKRLASIYGPDLLLDAFARTARRRKDLRLVLVGDGPMRRELEARAAADGLADRVLFTGAVPHDALPDVYRSFDLFAMPTVVDEALGVAALEASSCGLPVIATNTGGIPEAVRDRGTGLLVPPGDAPALADAIERLADDPEYRHRLGREGRVFVEQAYGWSGCVDRMIGVYEGVGSGKRTRGV